MKSGTNRLITERYITNTERSVGNLSYICPLPLGFDYTGFGTEEIQNVKENLIKLEKEEGIKFYQNIITVKSIEENGVNKTSLSTKWTQVKAEDIPVFTKNDNVYIGLDENTFTQYEVLIVLFQFQPFAIEVNDDLNGRELQLFSGTTTNTTTVTIGIKSGSNLIGERMNFKLNVESLPEAHYNIG